MNIDDVKQERETAVSRLYVMRKGQRVQRHSSQIHAEKMREIQARYNAQLKQIMNEAQQAHAAAVAKLEKLNNPFNVYLALSGDELERARRLADFVAVDFAAAGDAEGVASLMSAALATGDKALAWLALRHGAAAYDRAEYDPVAASEYRQVVGELETAVFPADDIAYKELVQGQATEAQETYGLAERHTDDYKRAIADSLNVNPTMVPDPAL